MKKIILLFSTIFIHLIAFSQFTIDWQQSYGGMENEEAWDIVQTSEGFFLGGTTFSMEGQITCNTENGSYWMLHIDETGNILWQRCYEYIDAMRLLKAPGNNNHYYMIGEAARPHNLSGCDLFVARFDEQGDFIWKKSLGSSNGVRCYFVDGEVTSDGGVIAVSNIDAGGGDVTNHYGSWDGWITKFDSLGNLQWEKTFGSTNGEIIGCITQLTNKYYIAGLAGIPQVGGLGNIDCIPFSTTYPDIIIYVIDSLGNPVWHNCYGGSKIEEISEILELDDGFLIAATTNSRDGDVLNGGLHGDASIDIWLVKIDFEGLIIWQKCYGGTKFDYAYRIFNTEDNGIITFAYSTSYDCDVQGNIPSENPSIWVFKIDSEGEILWQKCILSSAREYITNGVIKHNDNKFTIAGGMTYSPTYDINCSNFDSGSRKNFYAAGISITEVSTPELSLNENKFNIYPVPSNGTVTIEIPEQPEHDPFTIDFIDLKGIIRKTVTQPQPIGHYDISHLPPGMYMVRIRNSMGVVYKKVLISM